MKGFEGRPRQDMHGAREIDLDGFSDGAFAHECPRCGFRFNGDGE